MIGGMTRRRFLLRAAGLAAAAPLGAHAVPMASEPFRLRLLDAHTGATFDGVYRDAGGPIARVIDELNLFLRDHHSGRISNIDVGVIDFLADIMAATGQTRATVLSAFRSIETNRMLARTTFGVAENSQHIYGRALDVQFPAKLHDAVAAARAMKRGGVGWYPHSGFIHLDTGPVRNWDHDDRGLQDLLIARSSTPPALVRGGKMVVNGPVTLIIEHGKPPVMLSGRVWSPLPGP
jgi:uncharacterized protein YcbK (DUF882 family)